MINPIPRAALDDRLGFIGTSGSGKTYAAGVSVEVLLDQEARVVIVDPLGVWWGLRLLADGKTAPKFDVAIFGGAHGDLPLTEHAGVLIGETAATMAESCIIDLSELRGKAAERRFMTAFLDTIYLKATKEPFHLVVDEADLFAPQKPAKGAEMLLGNMEDIVRRGRVKGFIPWLISQRPAVINKNVLSQVDGLIAFKLTATQDRDALDDWIEGQADKGQGKEIKDALPTLQTGHGVIWLPGHGILKTAQFPRKATFDSSRTPKRGEKLKSRKLKPLDLGMLKDRLAMVEEEAKANDPRKLKAEIAALRAEKAKRERIPPAAKVTPDKDAIKAAEQRGFEQAKKKLVMAATRTVNDIMRAVTVAIDKRLRDGFADAREKIGEDIVQLRSDIALIAAEPEPAPSQEARRPAQQTPRVAQRPAPQMPAGGGALTGPQRQLLQSLAWWRVIGHDRPTRVQIASICGWHVTSGHLKNVSGSLRSRGLIDYPTAGTMALTDEGADLAPAPDMSATLEESVRAILTGPQCQAFDCLPSDGSALSREQLAEACGWNVISGHVKNVLGSMRSLKIIDYPSQGTVARADWLAMARAA